LWLNLVLISLYLIWMIFELAKKQTVLLLLVLIILFSDDFLGCCWMNILRLLIRIVF